MANEKRVLLVDDEPLVRRSLQKTLVRAGYVVALAADCKSGLAAFEQAEQQRTPFDLAVLDINMPDFAGQQATGAGLQLLREIMQRRPELPTVMLTAYDEVNKAKEAINAGARSYFVKGREQGLVKLIDDLLN